MSTSSGVSILGSVPETSNGSRCRGRNRAGLPCQRRAVTVAGYCTVHDPETAQDMRELGRRGGSVRPNTKLRQAADDTLREQARDVLSRALSGDQVDKAQLDAARSLFSYRAAEAPARDREQSEGVLVEGKRVTSLADVLVFAQKIGQVSDDVLEAAKAIVASAA
jgi:hypothetical protein